MTLDEEIKYYEEMAEITDASEHRQLAKWLKELQNYQTAREEINQEIINWNDIDNGKVRGLFLAESIIAHYVDGGKH